MLTYTTPELVASGSIVARTLGKSTGITREPGTQFVEKQLDTNGVSVEGALHDSTAESGSSDMD